VPQEDVSPARAQAYAQYVAPTLLGIARRAVDLAELEEGDSVLDVATGTGLAAFLAAERLGPEGTVIGLDRSPAMLAVAGERALGAGSPQIRWQEGDPSRLSYADESFDAVLLLQALFDDPRPDAVLEELRRVLVEGGRLVLTSWGSRASNEWIDLVERALRPLLPGRRALPFTLPQSGNLEALVQGAGFEQIEVGRVGDRMRFLDANGLWHWAAASREWGGLLGSLSESDRDLVQGALATALAGRQRGGEATVGREIVFVRAIAPASP
jgi:SAM-dependent methyltransferase